MRAKARNILQQRADEDARARREVERQRKIYKREQREVKALRPLTWNPFVNLSETIFHEED